MRPTAAPVAVCWLLCLTAFAGAAEPDSLALRPAVVANHRLVAPLDVRGLPSRPDSWEDGSVVLRGSGGGLGWRDNTACYVFPLNDLFGSAVDLEGDTVFIAAAGESRGGYYGGAVYVYRKQHDVWRFAQKLTGPPDAPWLGGDNPDAPGFASVVCRDGLLLVGAPGDGPRRGPLIGAVHVFEPCTAGIEGAADPTWCFAQTLRPPTVPPPGGCNFGEFLATDGAWLMVASHRRGAQANDGARADAAGTVDVFRRGDDGRWLPTGQEILSPEGATEGMFFGTAVAMDAGHALIGEPRRTNAEGGMGKAYAFELQGDRWMHVQTLALPDPRSGAFGVSIAVDDDHAVIGTYCDRSQPMAFFYHWDGSRWILQQSVTMAHASIFGVSVALSGDLAVVGAPGESAEKDQAGTFHGAAHLFRRDVDGLWSRVAILRHPEPRPYSFFGGFFSGALAIEGQRVVVGTHTEPWLVAPHLGVAAEGPGSAVIFEPAAGQPRP